MFRNQWRYFEQGMLSVHYYTRNTRTIDKIFEVTVNNAEVNYKIILPTNAPFITT